MIYEEKATPKKHPDKNTVCTNNFSGAEKRGFLERFFFCEMYASLGCGAPSAKCTAGPTILGYFLFPSA